jgi:hypothetical protein
MTLEFEVVDGVDGRPLEGVRIDVYGSGKEPRASGTTDAKGRATLVGAFEAAGTISVFGRKNDATIRFSSYTLDKPGYVPRYVLQNPYYLGSKPPRPRFRWGLTPVEVRKVAAGGK